MDPVPRPTAESAVQSHGSPWQIAETEILSGRQLRLSAGPGPYNSALYVSTAGQEMFTKLGLLGSSREALQALDELAQLMQPFEFGFYRELGFLKDSYEGLLPAMKLRVAGVELEIAYVGSGYFGSVYRISNQEGASYSLKVYYRRALEYSGSGPWNEAARGAYLTAQGVSDMPRLCLAHPGRNWIVTEFVDTTYSSSTPTQLSWRDLGFHDLDPHKQSENECIGSDGTPFRVDFGHLAHGTDSENSDRVAALTALKLVENDDGDISSEQFLELYRANPGYRLPMLTLLYRVPPAERTGALAEMYRYPEAAYFPLQDYIQKGVISPDHTRELFELMMKHKEASVRAQGIFRVNELSDADRNYLGRNWFERNEFVPFMVYLGQKRFGDYLDLLSTTSAYVKVAEH